MNEDIDPKKTGIIIGIVVVLVGLAYYFIGRQPGDRSGKQFNVVLSGPKAIKMHQNLASGWVPGRGSANHAPPGGVPAAPKKPASQ